MTQAPPYSFLPKRLSNTMPRAVVDAEARRRRRRPRRREGRRRGRTRGAGALVGT